MTLEINQHINFGNSLKETRRYLTRYIGLIPPNTDALRKATQALHAIDELASGMEELLHRKICPRYDTRKMIPGVYSGDELYVFNSAHKHDPRSEDVFQGWYADEF